MIRFIPIVVHRWLAASMLMVMTAVAAPVRAQQRPLITEDPETVGAGRLLIESGIDYARGQKYPVSGLEGRLLRVPLVGLSIGLSSIADLQLDGGFYNHLDITKRQTAPLSGLLTVKGNGTHDVEDWVIATKIKLVPEGARRPSFGLRFATKLPMASNENGLGLDTTDFFASILGAKSAGSIRLVGNVGLAILGDPTSGNRQNDELTYGGSIARALSPRAELVAEINGRVSTRPSGALPGTETRGIMTIGGRYTPGPIRFDTGLTFGLTNDGPTVGFTGGFTYIFNAFRVP